MEMKNVKGSYDYGINEERVRSYIRNTLAKVFVKYGYQGIETPIINYYDLMALKYNDDAEILNEVYKLSDQGGRKLALRYDLTVPFAKYIAMNKDLVLPFKRFEMGNVFRDGPVKVGRNREFIQCDVDVVGLDNRMIEAELMALYIEGYKALDIDVVLKYNNRKIMQGMIENEGITGDKVSDVITVIDKFDKLTSQEIKIEFTKYGNFEAFNKTKGEYALGSEVCFNWTYDKDKQEITLDCQDHTRKIEIKKYDATKKELELYFKKEKKTYTFIELKDNK